MSLADFRLKVQGYRRAAGITQKSLARELGLHPNVLSHKLHESDGLRLTHGDVKRMVLALAKFQAIGTRAEAIELLELMRLKASAFTDSEWRSPPLRMLDTEPERPTPAPIPVPAPPRLPRHNLPTPATNLFGRDLLAARVTERLSEPGVRLITLTGLGGVGKTRLAIEVARRLLTDFPDGVTFVSLVGVGDPALVASEIAHTLGLKADGHDTPAGLLARFMSGKTTLLVLDNFEHVLTAAPLIGELLGAAPDLKILVTSRVVLKLYGEYQMPVPPLDVPRNGHQAAAELESVPAVALFAARLRAVRPDFALNDSNARTVADICVRLNGLPLALELAAAKGRLFGPAALLQRLDQSLSLLSSASGGATQRHHTLRDTIAWSYRLLTNDEQGLFRWVALFPGGCTVEALEAVAGTRVDVIEGLTSLLDKSLTTQREGLDGQVRFGMLETLREFALEVLTESGELAAAREGQAAYYESLAAGCVPRFAGPEQNATFNLLEAELDNLRVVFQWALAHQPQSALKIGGFLFTFWYMRGYADEGRYWLKQALEFAPASGATNDVRVVYGDALYTAGTLAYWQSDFTDAEACLTAALGIWRELQEHRRAGNALNTLGNLAWDISDHDVAFKRYFEALDIARHIEEPRQMSAVLSNLGALYGERDDLENAERYQREALAIRREMGDKSGIAISLSNLGDIVLNQERYEQAALLFSESLALHRELGDKRSTGMSLNSLGTVALNLGDFAQAEARYTEAVALAREVGYGWGEASALCNLGSALLFQGEFGRAVATLNQSLTLVRGWGDRTKIALALNFLGIAALRLGDLDTSAEHQRESIALYRELDDRRSIAVGLSCFAAVLAARGDLSEAVRLWGAADRLATESKLALLAAERLRFQSDLDAARAALTPKTFDAAWNGGRAAGWQAVYARYE